MAAGDTFRAAASDQLEIWAERTGCEIVVAEGDKAKAATGKPMHCYFGLPVSVFGAQTTLTCLFCF